MTESGEGFHLGPVCQLNQPKRIGNPFPSTLAAPPAQRRPPSDTRSEPLPEHDGDDVAVNATAPPPPEDNGAVCSNDGHSNPAVEPSIGLDICEARNDADERPQLTGFWRLPWGWTAIGFWIAMVIKNVALGQMEPSLAALILLGLLDVAAVVCLILKICKVVKLRNLNAGRREARTPVSPSTSLVETYPEPESDNDDEQAAIHPSMETEGERERGPGESPPQRGEQPGSDGIQAPPEQPASPLIIPTPATAGLSNSPRRLLAPMLITLIPLAAIAGCGGLAYLLLGGPTVASSRDIVEPTPDLQATIEAAVALALAKTDAAAATSSDGPEQTDASATQHEVGGSTPGNVPTSPPELLSPFVCSYCDVTDVGLGHHVRWEWEPIVSETGRLAVRALIDEQADFSGERIASCTANVSLSDHSGAFYGWVISRNRAQQCGTQPADWVSDSYHYENNILSLEVQLDAAAATHPGLEVCLWTGGATKKQTRLLNCAGVRQP